MPRPRAPIALALLLLVTGCSSDEPRRPAEPTSSPAPTAAPLPLPVLEAPDRDPIRTSTRAVWDDARSEEERGVQVVGDRMLLTGERPEVVDLRSGRTVWRAPTDDIAAGAGMVSVGDPNDEPVLVDTAAGPLVVLSYFALDCAYGCPAPRGRGGQRGLVAMDPRTGRPAWGTGLVGSSQADYVRPDDRDEQLSVMVEGASSTAVVAGVADYGILFYGRPERDLPAYAVGLDPKTGRRLWARKDLVVDAVAGDLVVGRVNDERRPAVVGLDAATGEELWRSTETSKPVSVSPRVVVIDDPDGAVRLLDARTGKPAPAQPPAGTGPCATWTSGNLDVACAWSDREDRTTGPRLLSAATDGSLSLSAPLSQDPRADWTPAALHDGAVTLDSYLEVAEAVDAAGRTLVPHDPDLTVAFLDDRYVVLGDGTEYDGYTRLQVLRRR